MGRRSADLADGHRDTDLPADRRGGRRLSGRARPERLPGLVDAHAHLQHPRFDADRDAVLDRARQAGIERILVPGWDLPSSEAALELAARHPDLLDVAVGIHPHDAAGMVEASWGRLEELAVQPAVVAIGEIGLDFHRNLSPHDVQRDAFARQLDLAARRRLPVVVHDRDAHDAVTEALLAWAGTAGGRGMLHAFSGDADMAGSLSAVGFVVSFALPVAFRSAVGPRAAAAALTAGRFLVETDAPYLGPDRDARNEPTTVLRTTRELGRIRGEAPEALVAGIREAYRGMVGR
jgi:TatD DNase family protein